MSIPCTQPTFPSSSSCCGAARSRLPRNPFDSGEGVSGALVSAAQLLMQQQIRSSESLSQKLRSPKPDHCQGDFRCKLHHNSSFTGPKLRHCLRDQTEY